MELAVAGKTPIFYRIEYLDWREPRQAGGIFALVPELKNAEFVMKACNSYADLLAACKAAIDDEECRFDHHGNCQTHTCGNPCEQKLLREAVAKAEGK